MGMHFCSSTLPITKQIYTAQNSYPAATVPCIQARTGHRADRAQARCAPRNLTWGLWRPLALAPPRSMIEPGGNFGPSPGLHASDLKSNRWYISICRNYSGTFSLPKVSCFLAVVMHSLIMQTVNRKLFIFN
jgi:hypothetical protein